MVDEPKICKWKEFLRELKEPLLEQAKKLSIKDDENCCVDEGSEEDVLFVEKGKNLFMITWYKNQNRLEIKKI